MPETLNSLNLKVTGDSTKAAKSIDDLIGRLSSLKKEIHSTDFTQEVGNFSRLATAMKELAANAKNATIPKAVVNSLQNLSIAMHDIKNEDISKLNRVAGALERIAKVNGFKEIAAGVKNISGSLDENGNIAKKPKSKPHISDETATSIQGITTKEQVLQEKMLDAFYKRADAFKKGNEERAKSAQYEIVRLTDSYMKLQAAAKKAADARKKAANAEEEVTCGFANGSTKSSASVGLPKSSEKAEKASKSISVLQRSLDKLKESAISAKKKFDSFIRSIGRIALYRMIRTVLKELVQDFDEGIKNMYQWSVLTNEMKPPEALDKFSITMDRFVTSMQYLKNGFASMFRPLIDVAVPILDEVVDKVVDFFNKVQEVIARVSGADGWTKALKVQKKFADETDGANESLKKMHELMGFDELNVINTPGSSSKGKDEEDYSSMFEWVAFTEEEKSALDTLVDKLKVIIPIATTLAGIILIILGHPIAGIALAGLGIVLASKWGLFDTLKEKIDGTFGQILATATMLAGILLIVFGHPVAGIALAGLGIALGVESGLFETIANKIKETWDKAYKNTKEFIQKCKDWVKDKWHTVTDYVKGKTAEFKAKIATKLSDFKESWNKFKDWVKDKTANFKAKIATKLSDFKESWSKFSNKVQDKTANFKANVATKWADIKSKWENISGNIKGKTADMKAQVATKWSDLSTKWNLLMNNFKGKVVDITLNLSAKVNNIKEWINSSIIDPLNERLDQTSLLSWINIPRLNTYANGGFVSQGTMFVAGEVPGQAEMVGNIGGRTGVASGQEITGIREAIDRQADAEVRLLQRLIAVVDGKELTLAPSASAGRWIKQSQRAYAGVTG